MSDGRMLVVAATDGELRGVPDDVEQLVCGVGPVDAAIATAARLARGGIDAVLHIGIAGVRAGADVEIGDVVIGASARWCDTASQYVEQHASPDPTLLAAVRSHLPDAHVTVIGTSADVAGTHHHIDVDVEAMEGFAVVRAAKLAGVPAIEVRVISNEINEPDRAKWQFDRALGILASTVPALLVALRG